MNTLMQRGPRLAFVLLLMFCAARLVAQTEKITDLVHRADAAFADEDRKLAQTLYLQVLEINPEQSHAVYRLGQLARNDETALRWYRRYAELEPDDAWGWLAVGDKYLRLGKPVEALGAYGRAARLAPKAEDVQQRLANALFRNAPALEPAGAYSGDSDGNRTWRFGLSGDVAMRGGFRFGARATRSDIDDGLTTAVLDEGVFRLEGRPRPALRLALDAGAARLAAKGSAAWTTPEANLRIRWRAPDSAAAVDIRAQRMPLGTTPLLVSNRAMRNELRLEGTAPAGPLRLRIGGRAAEIETAIEKENLRLQGDAAVAFPIGWRGEVSAQYHRLGFQRISDAGYFAPQRVETMEGGTYWELGGDGRWSAEVDLGIGLQRLEKHKEQVGPWKPALRGWGSLYLDLTRTVRFTSEVEAYSAPFAPAGAVTTPNWRYVSLTFGLLFRIL
jgi:hypothetical protein